MTSGIYKILNKVTGDFYIGSSQEIRRRTGAHVNSLLRGNHCNLRLQRSFDKYGEDAFCITTVLVCSKEDLLFYEDRLIKGLTPTYNLCPNAGRTEGSKREEAFKKKVSERMRGNKHAVGRNTSELQRAHMVGNTYGANVLHTEEFKKAMSERLKGNSHALGAKYTDEQRKARSEMVRSVWAARKAATSHIPETI